MAWLCTSCSVAIVSAPCLLQYCWVHPEKEAAIQCILCLRCKVRHRLGGAAPCSLVADRLDGTADKQAGRHARRSCSRRRGATAGAGRVPSPLQLLSLRLSGPAVSSLSHHQDPLGVLFCQVDIKKSYHCSAECLREHWAFHRDFHQQSRENGARRRRAGRHAGC